MLALICWGVAISFITSPIWAWVLGKIDGSGK